MIGVSPSNLIEANDHNAALPEEVRRMASGQYLSSLAYTLANQCPETFPHDVWVLSEEGTFKYYTAHSLNLTPELYGYYLLPQDKSSGEIKVIFRGTELDEGSSLMKAKSMLINLEAWGPAMASFERESAGIFERLHEALQDYYDGSLPPLSLQVCGHSQGGALSQLFVTEFLRQRLMHSKFDAFQSLTMTALNSPGVVYDIAQKCADRLRLQKDLYKPLRVVANYGLVGGDLVQTQGLDMIFANMLSEEVELNVMKIDRGLEGYWHKDLDLRDGLDLGEIIQTGKNITNGILGAHKNSNFFAPLDLNACIQIDAPYVFYTNRRPGDIEPMLKELLNKKPVIGAILFYLAQDLIRDAKVLPYIEYFTGSVSGWTTTLLEWMQTPTPGSSASQSSSSASPETCSRVFQPLRDLRACASSEMEKTPVPMEPGSSSSTYRN